MVISNTCEIKPINAKRLDSSDKIFRISIATILFLYALLLASLLGADIFYMIEGTADGSNPIMDALADSDIRHSILLSLISCSLSAFLSVFVAVPIGYILARYEFWGKRFVDALLDIPIILPPLVIGISLLILFQFPPLTLAIADILPIDADWAKTKINEMVVYQVPAVILAQFTVAAAFAIRTLKVSFEQTDSRREHVALTLGCSRFQAFRRVVLPEVTPGIITAWTLAWARSLGEFGPLLIFAGATRGKTEVLSTTVFLEMSIGNLQAAVAVSLIMIMAAVTVLIIARVFGSQGGVI